MTSPLRYQHARVVPTSKEVFCKLNIQLLHIDHLAAADYFDFG